MIYLDGHSTTPLAPEALAAMMPWWIERAANPGSPHRMGLAAADAVETAREQVAGLIGAAPSEVVFTSGATEANNLAVIGSAEAILEGGNPRREVVLSAVEHKSILATAGKLSLMGFTVRTVPVDGFGRVDVAELSRLLGDATALVSVMAVNNEVGTVQPLSAVAQFARERGALVHVDAAQAAGRIPFDCTPFDTASLSSHKMFGPPGIGALFISAAAALRPRPLTFGGGQENGMRPGTIPVPLAVGFGTAAALAGRHMPEDNAHCSAMAAAMTRSLAERQVRFDVNVPEDMRVPGSLSVSIQGIDASELVGRLAGSVAVSEGSACNSGQFDHSHVLKAMGFTDERSRSTIRMYFSRYNDLDELSEAADLIAKASQK